MEKRKKNIASKTHKKYIKPGSKEVSQKFCGHDNLCKYSQTHKQLNSKSRNDPLQDDKSNKRTYNTNRITKGTLTNLTTKPHAEPDPKKNLQHQINETEN